MGAETGPEWTSKGPAVEDLWRFSLSGASLASEHSSDSFLTFYVPVFTLALTWSTQTVGTLQLPKAMQKHL